MNQPKPHAPKAVPRPRGPWTAGVRTPAGHRPVWVLSAEVAFRDDPVRTRVVRYWDGDHGWTELGPHTRRFATRDAARIWTRDTSPDLLLTAPLAITHTGRAHTSGPAVHIGHFRARRVLYNTTHDTLSHGSLGPAWENLGARLGHLRRTLCITQDETATVMGLDRSAIVESEQGMRRVDALQLHRLAGFYATDITHLLHRLETDRA